MFYYLEGTVALIEKEMAVIDCGGVGYACHTSQNTCASIRMGEKTRLYTYLSIRENACDLYGFAQQEELNCFKLLRRHVHKYILIVQLRIVAMTPTAALYVAEHPTSFGSRQRTRQHLAEFGIKRIFGIRGLHESPHLLAA